MKTRALGTFTFLLASLESRVSFRRRSTRLPIEEIEGFDPPQKASAYQVIAEEDYNLGNAYFCVDPASGSVYRVCPEYSTSFELVSSSVEALRTCMEAAAQWSSQNPTAQILTDPKKTVDALEKQLAAIDPTALASPKSHWPLLLDHIRHYAPDDDDELEFWFKLS